VPVLTTDTALTAPADPGSVRDIAIEVLMAGESLSLLVARSSGLTQPGCRRLTAQSVTSIAHQAT
jgi:hypothetical protein